MSVGGQGYAPVTQPRQRDTVPILQEGCWVPGSVLRGAENLVSTEIRFSDGSNFVAVIFLNNESRRLEQ
jgi:hypothetical protein